MKKLIYILVAFIACTMFNSCQKFEMDSEEQMATVSFFTSVGNGEPMTKSVSGDLVRAALQSAIPPYVVIHLKKLSNGNEVVMRSDEVTKIPLGDYEITLYEKNKYPNCTYCYNRNNKSWDEYGGQVNYVDGQDIFFASPLFSMEKITLSITSDCTIPLNLKYNCSALVFNHDVCGTANKRSSNASEVFYTTDYENLSIIFIRNADSNVTMEMTPKDGLDLEKTTYKFNAKNLEKGKYYVLECQECGKGNAGFNVGTETWGEGTI